MSFKEWMKEGFKEEAERQKLKSEEKQLEKKNFKNRLKQMDREGIAYCPKCKGTSIQYAERRKNLSVGRGVVGGVLLGPLGAGIGAVTSKKYKGFVKCLNCGHKWKI